MYYIGIDLGGTNIAAGVTDENGRIIAKASTKTYMHRPLEEIVKDMVATGYKACEDAGIEPEECKGFGVGTPGTVDPETGIVAFSNNIPMKNTPLADMIRKHTILPVYINNDANCAALGELVAGAAKGTKNAILITIGTGIGGGIIIDGKIYEGTKGAGAETGHIVIISGGLPCSCGRRGCWEVYASATALVRETREAAEKDPKSLIHTLVGGNLDAIDARVAFEAARGGDKTSIEVVNNYVVYLGEGLADMINIFRPEVLLIGGGVCNEGDYLLNPVREFLNKNVYGADVSYRTTVERAVLGNDAGIVGAAMLARM